MRWSFAILFCRSDSTDNSEFAKLLVEVREAEISRIFLFGKTNIALVNLPSEIRHTLVDQLENTCIFCVVPFYLAIFVVLMLLSLYKSYHVAVMWIYKNYHKVCRAELGKGRANVNPLYWAYTASVLVKQPTRWLFTASFYLNRCGAQQGGDLGSSSEALDGILGFGQSNSSVLTQLASAGKVKKVFSHCLDTVKGGGIWAIGEVVQPKMKTTPLVPDQCVILLISICLNTQVRAIMNWVG